jgi:hypothetical protein
MPIFGNVRQFSAILPILPISAIFTNFWRKELAFFLKNSKINIIIKLLPKTISSLSKNRQFFGENI